MLTAETINQVRQALEPSRGKHTIGFVPTMGALHAGHAELIRTARRECGTVVVSVFVNPIQFSPGEDFKQYPRALEDDLRICNDAGVDLVLVPSVEQMYPTARRTTVHVSGITESLCGASRPGHFDGVATVVAKLFNIIQADRAYFGQKDAQQALVVRKMITDLNFPIRLRVCITVRDEAGLALSSRNRYLSDEQRNQALCLYQALRLAKEAIGSGERDSEPIVKKMRQVIDAAGPAKIDYISIVDTDTVQAVRHIDRPVLIALAVQIGPARLIDNIMLDAAGREITINDLAVQA
jgi:pantoate--beta-alanine ligase